MGRLEDKVEISLLKDKVEKLEKALDKACKILEENALTMYDDGISFTPCIMNDKLWKEYLLNESEGK